MIKTKSKIVKRRVFFAVNEIGPQNVIRHIADHKNKCKPHHSLAVFLRISS
jgi:hypothetical protein